MAGSILTAVPCRGSTTRVIVAKPHLPATYPDTNAVRVADAVRSLQARADAAQIDVRLVAGAEVEVMHGELLDVEALPGLRLGESPYTLVELRSSAGARFAEMRSGPHGELLPAVLAHPERCRASHEDPKLVGRRCLRYVRLRAALQRP